MVEEKRGRDKEEEEEEEREKGIRNNGEENLALFQLYYV